MSRPDIAFAGVDHTGKTTQINMLLWDGHDRLNLTPRHWSGPSLSGDEAARWWFEDVSMEGLMDTVIRLLQERRAARSDRINILDRGTHMYMATCAATLMTRFEVDFNTARDRVDAYFARHLGYVPNELEFLLIGDEAYQTSIAPFLEVAGRKESEHYSAATQRRYVVYQANLRLAVQRYLEEVPPNRLIRVDAPAVEIQNRIRAIINDQFGLGLTGLADNLKLLVGLGGLSECGKSSTAEHLRLKHGFGRLKLRYFIEHIRRGGRRDTPELVALEVLEFMRVHRDLTHFSVESLHDPQQPAMFKLLLGNRFQIVYLDVERDVRIRRSLSGAGGDFATAAARVDAKDAIKRSRGAEMVQSLADVVWDNSGEECESKRQLARQLLGG